MQQTNTQIQKIKNKYEKARHIKIKLARMQQKVYQTNKQNNKNMFS